MYPVDYLIITLLIISLLYGIARGFMREALSVLGWLGGLWIAWRYADAVKPMVGGLLVDEPIRTWVARVIVLAAVVSITWLLNEVLSYFIHQSGLSVSVDRFLGGFFGLLRGVVVVALLTLLGKLVHLDEMRWWKKSALLPTTEVVSEWFRQFAESGVPRQME